MRKIDKLIKFLHELDNSEFTGLIRISYSQGGITKVEKTEDVLKKLKEA
jgi:hypothetical protein